MTDEPTVAPEATNVSTRSNRKTIAASGLVGAVVGAALVFGYSFVHPLGTANIGVSDAPLAASGDATAVAQKLGPAVGTVVTSLSGGHSALGSAFVIAHDNKYSYLLTNNHVVDGAQSVHVAMPNGDNLSASVVGADALDDLAVLSVSDTSLPVAVFGKSANLQVGQEVVEIGSPLGNAGSVSSGVISALHRTINAGDQGSTKSETLEDVMQTNVGIDPGNSGGPLADANGRVVGVNVAYSTSTSTIGYSIPSDLASSVAQTLIAHQKVLHPFLGVGYLSAIDAIEAGKGFNGPGVLVTDVRAGSPAAAAGFQTNDILVAVNGVNIDNGQTLGGLIQTSKVGQTLTLTVSRGGKTVTLTATLVDRPSGS